MLTIQYELGTTVPAYGTRPFDEPTTLAALLDETVRAAVDVDDAPAGYAELPRPRVATVIADPPHGLDTIAVRRASPRVRAGLLPLTWQVAGGRLTITGHPASPTWIDACRVELSGKWNRGKADAPNRVAVVDAAQGTTLVSNAEDGEAPVETSVTTVIDPASSADLARLGGAYLAERGAGGQWTRDSSTYRPASPTDLGTAFMPDQAAVVDEASELDVCYLAPFALSPVRAPANLAGGTWYAGRLHGVDLTIAGGEVHLEVAMTRDLPRVSPTGDPDLVVTWASLRATYPAVAFRAGATTLDPAISYADLRLIRRP